MRLLEREAALAALAEYADDAARGDGRLVLIGGEAGVGKSALVEAAAHDVTGAEWSWGACDGLFTPRPLGPLFDLADQLGGPLLELCRARSSRDELFAGLLRAISRPDRLDALVIEDVHWADDATIDLLRFLGRRLRGVRALVVVTYREDGLSATAALRLALGDLASQRGTRRVSLAPLSAAGVGVLAEGSGLEPAELYRLTGGNPFFVTEILQAGTGGIPASARDATLARAARLSPAARGMLEAVAVIGARAEMSLVESVAPVELSTVDELLASGLVASDGGWLRFRHEIAQLAVAHEISGHRRAALHARVLAAMRDGIGADDAAMAFHAEQAGDALAVVHFGHRAAVRAAELAAHHEAVAQYERALSHVGPDDAALEATLCVGLADELDLLNLDLGSVAASERALPLWRRIGDRRREGDTYRRLSRSLWRLARGTGWDHFDESLAIALGTQEAQWIAPIRVHRAEGYWLAGDVDAARREIENAGQFSDGTDPWVRGEIAVWLRRTGSSRTLPTGLAEPYQLMIEGRYEGAAARFTELRSPYDAALALVDSGDPVLLRRAVGGFAQLDVAAAVSITRQRLRTLGVRVVPAGARAATREHPLGLTRREREVLDLICAGCTNNEIAAKLFISAKTVDHHVSAVLAKLGTPSRAAAASKAVRMGLATAPAAG